MPNESGAVNLDNLPKETQERLAQMGEDVPDSGEDTDSTEPNALYGFMVIVDPEGQVGFFALDSPDVRPILELNTDLVYGACAKVLSDISARETAQHMLEIQMAQARAIAEQQAAQRDLARLGDLKGGQRA